VCVVSRFVVVMMVAGRIRISTSTSSQETRVEDTRDCAYRYRDDRKSAHNWG
jgi:hypothetical protein